MADPKTQIGQLLGSSQAAGTVQPQHVLVVDSSGVEVSFGGGSGGGSDVQYTEDAAAAANPIGMAVNLIRQDTPTGNVSADGDNIAQRGTDFGAAYVTILDSAGSEATFGAGTQYTEGDTDASITGTAALVEGAANALAVLVQPLTDTQLRATPVPVSAASLPLPTGAATLAEQQTQTTSLQLIDDIVYTDDTSTHATGTSKGVLFMAAATPTDSAVNANDIGAVAMTTDRKLHVSVQDAIPAGNNNIGDVDVASVAGNVTVVQGTGSNLHTVVDSGVITTVSTVTSVTAIANALPTGNNVIGQVKLTDGTDIADVLDLSSSNPLAVAIVDTNGDQISSFGGGTQYTEDAAAAANPVGTVQILVRTDTPATQVTTDGDNIAQRGTNYGAAYVQVVSSSGSYVDTFGGGTQYTEDAAAAANPVGTALNLIRADALAGLTTTDGDNVAARGTDKGELYVKHVDAIPVTDNAGSLTVDGTVAVTNSDLTTIAGAVRAEDAVSSDGHTGIGALAVRKATPANTSGNDGDYEFLQMSVGRLWTSATIDAALPAGTNAIGKLAANSGVDIGDVDVTSISAGTNLIGYFGKKLTYAAKATITWTGTSLGNGNGRESTVIDNTSNRYSDVRIRIQTKGQASGTALIDVYVYTALGDTTYTDAATGSDAAFTASGRRNSRYLGSIQMNANTSAVQGELQLSDVFGTCPDKWGLIIINNSGAALSATAGDHVLEYEGIY